VIGFHCPPDYLRQERLLAVLRSAPAEVAWLAPDGPLRCRVVGDVLLLGVAESLWVNLWVEAGGYLALAAIEEALVWGCAARPVVLDLPDRLAWVAVFLAKGAPRIRDVARRIVSARCRLAACVADQDFETAGLLREEADTAAESLRRMLGH